MHTFHQGLSNSLMPNMFTHDKVFNMDKAPRYDNGYSRCHTHIAMDHSNNGPLLLGHKEGRMLIGKNLCKQLLGESTTLNGSKELRKSLSMDMSHLGIQC